MTALCAVQERLVLSLDASDRDSADMQDAAETPALTFTTQIPYQSHCLGKGGAYFADMQAVPVMIPDWNSPSSTRQVKM